MASTLNIDSSLEFAHREGYQLRLGRSNTVLANCRLIIVSFLVLIYVEIAIIVAYRLVSLQFLPSWAIELLVIMTYAEGVVREFLGHLLDFWSGEKHVLSRHFKRHAISSVTLECLGHRGSELVRLEVCFHRFTLVLFVITNVSLFFWFSEAVMGHDSVHELFLGILDSEFTAELSIIHNLTASVVEWVVRLSADFLDDLWHSIGFFPFLNCTSHILRRCGAELSIWTGEWTEIKGRIQMSIFEWYNWVVIFVENTLRRLNFDLYSGLTLIERVFEVILGSILRID